jgi:hypothetical protein
MAPAIAQLHLAYPVPQGSAAEHQQPHLYDNVAAVQHLVQLAPDALALTLVKDGVLGLRAAASSSSNSKTLPTVLTTKQMMMQQLQPCTLDAKLKLLMGLVWSQKWSPALRQNQSRMLSPLHTSRHTGIILAVLKNPQCCCCSLSAPSCRVHPMHPYTNVKKCNCWKCSCILTAFLNSSNSPKTMSLPFASNLQHPQKTARRAGWC